ncbi:hypothetical protein LMG28688_06915 [Paraburkholderia caffeinitolerans]|uniref:DUF3274 domain-containing protein n=1 Tax=Paraburkholderia caffeinitolerans TaxID=1723730 RepID=A0A6J5H516_9BURK|nr:DUF3274 domain-containing protein [Paraburkholderia caffeinitolerans]CAB3809074.1 hypothetical protein LMG28688_06915 [Paraburkholderia caffeinitolerans]
MSATEQTVTASASAVTNPKYNDQPRLVEVPADRPGIVIFLHGVNDPGATYEKVERGMCEGLNWRLDRTDLKPGAYGAVWKVAKEDQAKAAKNGAPLSDDTAAVVYDPDTFLYRRTEDQQTNSMFLPFYWGYRAADGEIAKDKSGQPVVLRSQHQDAQGNRLDTHFAKEGGYFDNATNNLPDMYGEGFKIDAKSSVARHATDRYTYIGNSPKRLYFVLAAHRLAALIREIRQASGGQGTSDETITVMGHSQGTLITLLAHAILAKDNVRPADSIIMVDSPYAVWENGDEEQTSQAKIKTLGNIVETVAKARHNQPPLADLSSANSDVKHRGRAGPKWSPAQGMRPLGPNGADVKFAERDNRGRVHMYFVTDDQVVALDNIRGIGTYGLPDTVRAPALGSGSWGKKIDLPAMDAIRNAQERYGFYQRFWTKLKRDGQPVPVGLAPQTIKIRESSEARYPGGNNIASAVSQHPYRNLMNNDGRDGSLDRWINGEQIDPPWFPNLFGGETLDKKGNPSGLLPVDPVAVDVALGNPMASYDWRALDGIPDTVLVMSRQAPSRVAQGQPVKQWYNSGKLDINDHTSDVVSFDDGQNFYRRETPNEVRERLTGKDATANNYHSGILNDSDNVRAVAAMDAAVGQAKTLDDPDWRAALIALADWRTDWGRTSTKVKAIYETRFSDAARNLADATFKYYSSGVFPDESLVPRTWPPLVASQTKDEREEGKNDPGVLA